MTDVTLSICIPTYNRAAFLDYSLSNLAAARFPFPIEIVISDNASTDETPAQASQAGGARARATCRRRAKTSCRS